MAMAQGSCFLGVLPGITELIVFSAEDLSWVSIVIISDEDPLAIYIHLVFKLKSAHGAVAHLGFEQYCTP